MNRLVLGALTKKNSIILLARTLNERGHHGVKLALVVLMRRGLDNLHQTVKTLKNDLVRCGVIDLGSRGTGTLGVDKGVGLRITNRLGKRKRLFKIFFGLAGETNDDVGGKRDIGHAIANTIDQAQIVLARIATIHLFEDARRTRLNGQMQLRHNGRRLGHGIDGLGQQILRVRGSEEDALHARIAHGTQQVGKARLAKQVTPVGVDVLTQQRNLAHALTDQARHLVNDFLEGTALFAAANIRHDAVGAEVIAARHDGHPGVILRLAMPRHAHGVGILVLVRADMALAVQECLGNELGNMRNGMGTKNDVDVIDVGKQPLAVALGDTAADGNYTLARRRRRQALARIALSVQTGIGSLTHTTRHEDNDVGVLGIKRHQAAIRIEQTAYTLRVMLIHLTAKGANKVGFTGKNIACGTLNHVN